MVNRIDKYKLKKRVRNLPVIINMLTELIVKGGDEIPANELNEWSRLKEYSSSE